MKPRVAVSVVYVASFFMTILDSTVVNVALPTLRAGFRTSTAAVSSVVTGYLVALAVVLPAAAWLGDKFGGKRMLLAALALFTGASALCGLAVNLPQLTAFRAMQGVAGGVIMPTGSMILYRTFPQAERIRAMRLLMVPTLVAPALGPVLGGLLVSQLSWRWIFYVNLPVGVAAVLFGLRFLPEYRSGRPSPLDLPGFLLAGAGFPLAMFALTEGAEAGWASPPVLAGGVAGLGLLTAFITLELRVAAPLLRLRLLAGRGYRVASLAAVVGGAGFLGTLFLVPLFLQNGLGFSALHSGLSTFTEALGGMIGVQMSSRLFPRTGPRPLMTGGMLSAAAAVGALALTSAPVVAWAVPVLLFLTGLGFGFAMAPSQVTALALISAEETAQATTLTQVMRQSGQAIGVAVLATCLGALHVRRGDLAGYHATFAIAAAIVAAGGCLGYRVKKSDARAAMAEPQTDTERVPA